MKLIYCLVLVSLLSSTGWGRNRGAAGPPGPLSSAVWSALPAETKFEIDTLERLKAGEPKLQDDKEWDRFARKVLLPAQKKEFARGVAVK